MFDVYGGWTDIPKPLNECEEKQVVRRMIEGDLKAKELLIERNIRLVLFKASSFHECPVEREELVSQGFIGLVRAADTFDPAKNIRFAAYAGKCIENEMLMLIRKNFKYSQLISLNEECISAYFPDEERKEKLQLITAIGYCDSQIEDNIEREQINCILHSEALTEFERQLIFLRFMEEEHRLSQQEAAEFFKVSQPTISRAEKKVLKKIRKLFTVN